MKVRPIDGMKGAQFSSDPLQRGESANILGKIIKSFDAPFVLSINAPWGWGKTTFLLMWKNYLESEGIHAFYYNAWKNDYSDNPLITLISELERSAREISGKNIAIEPYISGMRKLIARLVKRGVPLAIKLATLGTLNLDDEIEGSLSETVESFVQSEINRYESSIKVSEEFRKNLSRFVSEIYKGEEGKKLVFIIDELDRCNPKFAIDLLESVKHVFDVDNVVFVLGVDKFQIENCVRAIYGQDVEVNGYLRRLIDFEYQLPYPTKSAINSVVNHFIERFGIQDWLSSLIKKGFPRAYQDLYETITQLSIVLNLSLRDIEKCILWVGVVSNIHETANPYSVLLATLIVLKVKSNSLYVDFSNRRKDVNDLLDFIKSHPGGDDYLAKSCGQVVEVMLRMSYATDLGSVRHKYVQMINSREHTDKERTRAVSICELIDKENDIKNCLGQLDFLLSKIEITSRFPIRN